MCQVSIIVPVFQAEKHISRCIDSILAQTFADFELILVDDGSSDSSGIICDKYALKDTRIRVIHKPNEGVSTARNFGLDAACGEYITFIDSDDYIDDHYLEKLIAPRSDLSICGSYIISEDGKKDVYIVPNEVRLNITKEIIANLFDNNTLKYVWGAMFKRTIIESHRLRFDSQLHLGEDVVFVIKYVLLCKTCALIGEPLYYYIKYPSNTLTKRFSPEMAISNNLRDQILGDIFKENGINSKVFNSPNYVSKQKMNSYFFSVFGNIEIGILDKYKWYRLFFNLPIYKNNIDILTRNCSKKLSQIIRMQSPTILILYEQVSKIKKLF